MTPTTNRLARYIGNGEVEIVEEPTPALPKGGLLVRTAASGLCSGELMSWYMDRKLPHVLGHEVSGHVIESDDERFPIGSLVFAHHHAPCLHCDKCLSGNFVHCLQWKATKLVPGGMAEIFAIGAANLTDTYVVDDLLPEDAALIEPLACVVKSLRQAKFVPGQPVAIIGLGVMGLLHHLVVREDGIGYDLNSARHSYAKSLGLRVGSIDAPERADIVVVCPGAQLAFDFAVRIVKEGGTIVLFAPFAPDVTPVVDLNDLYFRDITLTTSYSAGPNDTQEAIALLRSHRLSAKEVISNFISLEELPSHYQKMKSGEILKPMVLF